MLTHAGSRILETPRLVLRRFEEKDADAMFAWAGDPIVMRWLPFATHQSIDETREVLADRLTMYGRKDFYSWAVTEKDTSRAVGSISLRVLDERARRGDVVFCLVHDRWGRGYMSEALAMVLDFGFHTVGFNRIEASHSEYCRASGAVLRRCGMQYEGMARQYYYCAEGYQDCHRYAKLKSDR